MSQVKNMFRVTNAGNGEVDIFYNFFLGDTIPHVEQLNMWGDNDNRFSNDFNGIKNEYFGTPNERTELA